MASIRRSSPLASASFSASGALALPASIRKNSSFVRLANLVGFGKWAGNAPADVDDGDDNEEDEDEDEEDAGEGSSGSETPTDERGLRFGAAGAEGLLWDAKAALTANQALLAVEHYTTAALPPYRSPKACLALGRLLLDEVENAATPPQSRKGKEKATSQLAPMFPPPLSGKRDVEAMGIVGGWLVLGIAWVVQSQLSKPKPEIDDDDGLDFGDDLEDEPLTLKRKPHHTAQLSSQPSPRNEDPSQVDLLADLLQPLLHLYRNRLIRAEDPVALPPVSSSQLPDVIKSQGHAGKGRNAWHLGNAVAEKLLSLDLLKDGVGNEDKSDTRTQVLAVANFILGLTVPGPAASQHWKTIVELVNTHPSVPEDLVSEAREHLDKTTRKSTKLPGGPNGNYPSTFLPRHLTPPASAAQRHDRAVSLPQPVWRPSHKRQISKSSVNTLASSHSGAPSRLVSFTIRPSPSQASLSVLSDSGSLATATPQRVASSGSALDALRRIHSHMFEYETEDEEDHYSESTAPSHLSSPRSSAQELSSPATSTHPSPATSDAPLPDKRSNHLEVKRRRDVPTIRTIASTPQLPFLNLDNPPNVTSSASTPPRRRVLPFEPSKDQRINGVDPALAAAELSSALTKHVMCGVCNAKGVNFPNCRKCGLTFCSRSCRVDADKGGNGTKHVCGAWESRRLLSPPPISPTGRIDKEVLRRMSVVAH